jgi:hypothetical protein
MLGRPGSTGAAATERSRAVTKDRRPTLETVVTAAGVSLATVSKVLNPGEVSLELAITGRRRYHDGAARTARCAKGLGKASG